MQPLSNDVYKMCASIGNPFTILCSFYLKVKFVNGYSVFWYIFYIIHNSSDKVDFISTNLFYVRIFTFPYLNRQICRVTVFLLLSTN